MDLMFPHHECEIAQTVNFTGEPYFARIWMHTAMVAYEGEKMSKSLGNLVMVDKLLKKYSADAVRYWAANAKLGSDTGFSEEELQVSRRFLTKLWNAARFTLMHLEDYRGEKPQNLLPADAWILEKAAEVRRKVSELLSQYETGLARHQASSRGCVGYAHPLRAA